MQVSIVERKSFMIMICLCSCYQPEMGMTDAPMSFGAVVHAQPSGKIDRTIGVLDDRRLVRAGRCQLVRAMSSAQVWISRWVYPTTVWLAVVPELA